jgi:capsular polysaccharide biosynthesis protein
VTDDSHTSPRQGALRAALRHSAVLLLVLAAVGTVLGAGAGLRRAEDHTAEASILVSALTGNPFSPGGRGDDLINLETEAQLVRSDPVARDVASRLEDAESATALLGGLEVSVPPNTQILTIEYTAGTDLDALRRAQGFADAYLDFRQARSEQVVRSRTKRIQDQVDDQNETLSSLVARSNVETNTANRNLLQEQINGVTAQIGQLQAQLAELQTGSVDPGQVITPARVVGSSTVGVIAIYAFIGLLVGLALGLGVVVVRARAENRIHHADDVTASGLALLGSISMGEIDSTNETIASSGGSGDVPIGPGLQHLRVSLLARERGRPLRILHAAAKDGPASPRVALGLAYATASSGLSTVLVDATNGSGEISELVGLGSKPGFNDVLAGHVDLHQALSTVSSHLLVLPTGHAESHVDDLLTGPLVGTLFGQLSKVAEVQIIATGPLDSPRSQALAMATDVIVVEAVESQSRLADLVSISEDPTVAESLLGVVFVGRARSRARKPPRT